MTHKYTYLILAASMLGFSALPAAADSQCPMGASLASYETANFSCYIGNLDFGNFTYFSAASPGQAVPASAVIVNPVDNASGIGFAFNSSWTASGAGSFSDGDIGFTVSVIGGGPATLEDAALIQTAGVDDTNTGSIASVAEDACSGSTSGTGCTQTWSVVTSQTSNTTATSSQKFFTPTGSLTVSKDINAQDGTSSSAFSTVSLVQDTFSQVPEPRAVAMLLGLCLLAGLTLKRKFQSVQS